MWRAVCAEERITGGMANTVNTLWLHKRDCTGCTSEEAMGAEKTHHVHVQRAGL